MKSIYLIIFFSFYPFPISSQINTSLADVITLISFCYFTLLHWANVKEIVKFKAIFPYAVAIVITVAISNLSNNQNGVGFAPIFKYIIYCAVFPIILISAIKNEISLYGIEIITEKFIKKVCVFGLLFCLALIFLILIGESNQDESGNTYIYQYHKNASGALLFIAACLGITSIILYKFWAGYVALFLSLSILIITGSRAYFIASIGFIISCTFSQSIDTYKIIKHIALLFLLATIFISLGWVIAPELFITQAERFSELLISSDDEINSANSRFILWALAINDFISNPIFGIGYGGFNPDLGGFFEDITEPHNAILQILSQGGLVGLTAFSATLFKAYRLTNKSSSQPAIKYIRNTLSFYIIASMFGIIWVRGDGHIFWILFWFGVLTAYLTEDASKN